MTLPTRCEQMGICQAIKCANCTAAKLQSKAKRDDATGKAKAVLVNFKKAK